MTAVTDVETTAVLVAGGGPAGLAASTWRPWATSRAPNRTGLVPALTMDLGDE
jgi:hypothetical protein